MKALLKFTTSLVLVAAKSCEGAIGLGVTRTTGTAMGFADIKHPIMNHIINKSKSNPT